MTGYCKHLKAKKQNKTDSYLWEDNTSWKCWKYQPQRIEILIMTPLHFILSRYYKYFIKLFFAACVLIQLYGTKCWKIQNLAGLCLIKIFRFGKCTQLCKKGWTSQNLFLSITTGQPWLCKTIRRRLRMKNGSSILEWVLVLWISNVAQGSPVLELRYPYSWPALDIFRDFWLLCWGLAGWL